ncbi:hypothetical protein JB92DRAFT_2835402 [Gautieria morchelliformis]|nr:hypothetical protein JB92DRAFT_2835402 [Gautieria morchelliformis]
MTPPIASLERRRRVLGCRDSGRGGAEVDQGNLLSGVAGDREYRRAGRSVGVVGGRMSSTHNRGGNEAWWKRWDCRQCVLAGSGATRPAEGEQAGRLASVTPLRRGTFWFFPIFPSNGSWTRVNSSICGRVEHFKFKASASLKASRQACVERKLFTLNANHATAAYLRLMPGGVG